MSLEQVSKVTKIQQRILERIEAGRFDGLPAEVFVRGFVRSFARCVGLDETDALQRYAACGAGTGAAELTPTVRALVEAMVDLAPGSTAARQPRKLTIAAADAAAAEGVPATAEVLETIDFAASSGQMRAAAGGEVVEVMMLPETGTVLVPAQLRRQTIEMAAVVPPPELLAEAFPAEVVEEIPAVEPVAVIEAAAVEEISQIESVESLNPPVEIAAASVESTNKKKRGRRGGKGRNKREAAVPRLATGTPSEPTPVVALPVELAAEIAPEAAPVIEAPAIEAPAIEAPVEALVAAPAVEAAPVTVESSSVDGTALPFGSAAGRGSPAVDEPIATALWSPKMPPLATASPAVPWRRPAYTAAVTAKVPSLVIDDADPDSAERVLEERAEKHAPRRSFLPPILLDREDRSGRQGGLTLAVIILLIAATLTLSYLMRRPSAGGDGMTRLDAPVGDTVGDTFVG